MLLVGFYVMPKVVGIPFSWGSNTLAARADYHHGCGCGHRIHVIAAAARLRRSGATLASTLSVLMGVFGGVVVPHVVMPLFIKKLAMISPMYWAHQAYLDVLLREASFAVIVPKLIVLAVFAGICFYIAGREFNGFKKAYQELNVSSKRTDFKAQRTGDSSVRRQDVKAEDVPTDVPFMGVPDR